MPDDAEVYQKTPQDKVIILSPRAYLMQPFRASGWLDLRVGWFLSLTKASADDDPTVLGETITHNNVAMPPSDRYWIGLRNRGTTMPAEAGVTFIGFSNRVRAINRDPRGDSVLSSSDEALGTSNTNFWRPNNSVQNYASFLMLDAGMAHAYGGTPGAALAQHFPQSPAGAGGYAVLLAVRLTRDQPNSRVITAHIKSSGQSADMLYSDTPTKELIRDTFLTTWPASMTLGPVEMGHVPDAHYLYWPFRNSRLRVHSVGILKAA